MAVRSPQPSRRRKAPASRPLFRVFSTEERTYLYDTATNLILTIPEDLGRHLEKGTLSAAELAELAEGDHGGVLWPTSGLPLTPGPSRAAVERAVAAECRQVILEIARDCNMRCRYCVYAGRHGDDAPRARRFMPPETAMAAVDYLASHSAGVARVAVGFFGGEPLLAVGLIRQVVDHARSALGGKQVVFSITTNGTLLTRETMAFLAANDFTTLVSLDGPREAHDRNRIFAGSGGGTFDTVMARLREFRRLHGDYCRDHLRLAMVAVPGTDYVRLAAWLRATGLGARSSSPAVDEAGAYARAYRRRPIRGVEDLRAQYVEAAARGALQRRRGEADFSLHNILFSPTLSFLRRRPIPTSPRDRTIRRGMCTPGSERLFVDCRGTLYPCEKTDGFRHLRLGALRTGVDPRRSYELIADFHEFLARQCASCWLWRLCQVCAPGPAVGHRYNRAAARTMCENHRRVMTDMLTMYCTILERNPRGLDCFLGDDPDGP